MFGPVTDPDLPRLVALINRAYRGAGTESGWSAGPKYLSGDRTTEEHLRADLSETPGACLLKWEDRQDGALLGCVWLEPLDDDVWYLGTLATDPERHNSGLGRKLLAAAESWVRERGGKRIQMSVINVRDALIAWYFRRGYFKTGETHPFPYGDDSFGLPLRDDLSFVILEKTLVSSTGG